MGASGVQQRGPWLAQQASVPLLHSAACLENLPLGVSIGDELHSGKVTLPWLLAT